MMGTLFLCSRELIRKWGCGYVFTDKGLQLQAAFPKAKGFSARNLWKKWYSFYSSYEDFEAVVNVLSNQMNISSLKLQQVAAEIQEYLPTAEQIQQQIQIAEEEYKTSLSEKKDR